jgi:hypothetical protein
LVIEASLSGVVKSSGALIRLATEAALGKTQLDQSSLVAIVFSVLAVEAFVNELCPPDDGGADPGLQQKIKLLTKQRGISESLANDFLFLVQVRNSLIHLRPTHLNLDNGGKSNSTPEIVAMLAKKRVVTLQAGVQPTLMYTLRRSEVGLWAAKLAWRFIDELVERLPDDVRVQESARWHTIKGSGGFQADTSSANTSL